MDGDCGRLAVALHELGRTAARVGRTARAAAATGEAVALRRDLAAGHPDPADRSVRAGLASSLQNLGAILARQGDLVPAIAATREAAALRAELLAAGDVAQASALLRCRENLQRLVAAVAGDVEVLTPTSITG